MYHQQPPPNMQYGGYMMPPTTHNYPPQDMYYMQPTNFYDPMKPQTEDPTNHPTDVHELLQSVFDKSSA